MKEIAVKTSLGMSFDSARRLLGQFSREIGNPTIGEVQAKAVATFLRGRGTLNATWGLKYRILSGFYKFAISRGHTDNSPLPGNVPKLPPQQTPYVYSIDELHRLLEATSVVHVTSTPLQAPMYRTLLILLYGSALRIGEALNLTWLACALAHKACRDGFFAVHKRMAELFRDLAVARADGSIGSVLAKLARTDVLVLDDFAMAPMKDSERRDFLEICDDRYQRRSTILTSQLPVPHWHEQIGDPSIADSIMDRLVHNAHRIDLDGESIRKKRGRKPAMEDGK